MTRLSTDYFWQLLGRTTSEEQRRILQYLKRNGPTTDFELLCMVPNVSDFDLDQLHDSGKASMMTHEGYRVFVSNE